MKRKTFLLSALIGAASFKLYNKRQTISREIKDKTRRINQGKQDLQQIQDSLAVIREEGQQVSLLGQNLSYQARVFQTEAQATLEEIKKILAKYKSPSDLPQSENQ